MSVFVGQGKLSVVNQAPINETELQQSFYYGRRCRVLVVTDNNNVLDVSDLRCTFNITKTYVGEHYGIVTIYNLQPETENTIIKQGSRVIVEAGYEGANNYGQILDGDIIQPIRFKENQTTYALQLVSIDSDDFHNFGFVNFTVQRGQTNRDVIKNIASKSTIPAEINSISKDFDNMPKTTRGKTLFGLSKEYIRQLAQSGQAHFYMEDGKINIVKLTDPATEEAIELSYETGLVGQPEQIDFGVNMKCLLNPRIKLWKFVKVNNQNIKIGQINIGQPFLQPLDVDGLYRVFEIQYEGDTRGQPWYCNLKTVTQAGMTPAMLESADQYGR